MCAIYSLNLYIFAIVVEYLLCAEVYSDGQEQMHCVEVLRGAPGFLTKLRFCTCLSPLFSFWIMGELELPGE